jgi:uncharacterized protein
MDFIQLGKAQFIALETFKKNGSGVTTPVWVAPDNDTLFVWTERDSWKVKRIRNNSAVRLAESDARGAPKSDWFSAQAQVLDSDADIQRVKKLFKSKYGFQFTLFAIMGKLRGGENKRVAVEIKHE